MANADDYSVEFVIFFSSRCRGTLHVQQFKSSNQAIFSFIFLYKTHNAVIASLICLMIL